MLGILIVTTMWFLVCFFAISCTKWGNTTKSALTILMFIFSLFVALGAIIIQYTEAVE